jgi:hypothetical protein
MIDANREFVLPTARQPADLLALAAVFAGIVLVLRA